MVVAMEAVTAIGADMLEDGLGMDTREAGGIVTRRILDRLMGRMVSTALEDGSIHPLADLMRPVGIAAIRGMALRS